MIMHMFAFTNPCTGDEDRSLPYRQVAVRFQMHNALHGRHASRSCVRPITFKIVCVKDIIIDDIITIKNIELKPMIIVSARVNAGGTANSHFDLIVISYFRKRSNVGA